MTSAVEICKQVPDSMAPELFFVLSALSQEYFMKLFIKCMTNTVERTAFVRTCQCLRAHARVSPDLLDYLVDYHLALDLHI